MSSISHRRRSVTFQLPDFKLAEPRLLEEPVAFPGSQGKEWIQFQQGIDEELPLPQRRQGSVAESDESHDLGDMRRGSESAASDVSESPTTSSSSSSSSSKSGKRRWYKRMLAFGGPSEKSMERGSYWDRYTQAEGDQAFQLTMTGLF